MYDELHGRVGALEVRVDAIESGQQQLSDRVGKLDEDIQVLHTALGNTATKDDLNQVAAGIEHSINGLLRDALNAIPARHAALWTAIMAVVAVITLVLNLVGVIRLS